MISDEEVQSKGDVGASKDPPRKKSLSFKSRQHFVPGIVVDLLHRLECVSSIPGLFIFLVLKFMTSNILDRYATVYTQEHFPKPIYGTFYVRKKSPHQPCSARRTAPAPAGTLAARRRHTGTTSHR